MEGESRRFEFVRGRIGEVEADFQEPVVWFASEQSHPRAHAYGRQLPPPLVVTGGILWNSATRLQVKVDERKHARFVEAARRIAGDPGQLMRLYTSSSGRLLAVVRSVTSREAAEIVVHIDHGGGRIELSPYR